MSAGSCVHASSLLLLLLPAAVGGQEPIEIAGKYKCEGKNPNGGTYVGTVTITKKKETYSVEWRIQNTTQTGLGIFHGGTLSICWVTQQGNHTALGVAAYQLQKDRRTFVGQWSAVGGNGKTTKEVLRKSDMDDLLEVRGTDPIAPPILARKP